MLRLSLTLVLLFIVAPAIDATVIYVPDHHGKIQDAITAAAPGDEIIVRPGTYVETIDFLGKAVSLSSEFGPEVTTIDGNRKGSVVSFVKGETAGAVLEGFTIVNGSGTAFAATISGGGILCGLDSSPVIRGNVIRDNEAWDGGGIHVYDRSSPLIEENRIYENVSKNGGGINVDTNSTPTITGNTIVDNEAPVLGGGIACHNDCDALIEKNTISSNSSVSGLGGGIYCYSCTPTISRNEIEENFSADSGGGIYCKAGAPRIEGNFIRRNISLLGHGGGIECATSAAAEIVGNVIVGNTAIHGGGIDCFSHSDPTIVNTMLAGNFAIDAGGGIGVLELSNPTIVNCTLVDNSALRGGGGIAVFRKSNATGVNLVIWANHGFVGSNILVGESSFPASLTMSYSNVPDNSGSIRVNRGSTFTKGSGMLSDDPHFADIYSGDLHLTAHSPCLNSGDNSVLTEARDFEGDKRIIQGTVDIGADEAGPRLYTIGETTPGGVVAFKVVGTPGKTTQIALGSGIQDPPQATPHGDLWLITPLVRTWKIGTVPPSGVHSVTVTLPSGWVPGTERYFQAWVGAWGGAKTKLTNLLVLTVE